MRRHLWGGWMLVTYDACAGCRIMSRRRWRQSSRSPPIAPVLGRRLKHRPSLPRQRSSNRWRGGAALRAEKFGYGACHHAPARTPKWPLHQALPHSASLLLVGHFEFCRCARDKVFQVFLAHASASCEAANTVQRSIEFGRCTAVLQLSDRWCPFLVLEVSLDTHSPPSKTTRS